MNLENLLARLEKTAAEDEKKDDKKLPPWLKKDDEKKDDKSDDKKSEDKDEDKKDEDQEKKASVSPEAQRLAAEILGSVSKSGATDLAKQASLAGSALAELLQKQASAGDVNTENGVAPTAVANKAQADSAQIVAEDDSKIKALPGAGGTVNQIFDAVVSDALSQGAAAHDQVNTQGVASVEGSVQAQATPSEVPTTTMNKTATLNALLEMGIDLASAMNMVKRASAGDTNTADGTFATPNKIQADSAQIVAEDTAKIKPLPGAGGTVNQIFDAVVADALGQGAASHDQVHTEGVAAVEGSAEEQATPNEVDTAGVEKAAAVSELVDRGVDFYDAVELVKMAEAEILHDESIEKTAAMNSLMDEGYDFEAAADLVKEAGRAKAFTGIAKALGAAQFEGHMAADAARAGAKSVGKAVGGAARKAGAATEQGLNYAQLQGLRAKDAVGSAASAAGKKVGAAAATGANYAQLQGLRAKDALGAAGARAGAAVEHGLNYAQLQGLRAKDAVGGAIKRNPGKALAAAGAAGVAAGGAGGYAVGREKQAAVNMLVEQGVDFDSAVDLVAAKAQELYGE